MDITPAAKPGAKPISVDASFGDVLQTAVRQVGICFCSPKRVEQSVGELLAGNRAETFIRR